MGEMMLTLFREYPHIAVILSILANILIAISGVLPSYFLTAANIYFFGFINGTIISMVGESLGAVIAFIFYRKGFRRFSRKKLNRYRQVERLINIEGKEAFFMILSLRLMPFMPSGVVTFFSAIGVVSLMTFFLASTIGKLPALIMEALAVQQVLEWTTAGKVILAGVSLMLFYSVWQWSRKKAN
ncbi:TVP38/TMEM64 family protein [Pseudalkalibacillus sp. SCS-8]|uniref:TVP38/TMEM64 family protein n=1 Tax=Pseudalkalibacillus nanhaiensis TaxID=3115291 RepID=UPI0032DB21E3